MFTLGVLEDEEDYTNTSHRVLDMSSGPKPILLMAFALLGLPLY